MTSQPINKFLLPFETKVLGAVREVLPLAMAQRFDAQMSAINRVQRLIDWREIEFYCMSWFRVRWPQSILFDFRDEWRFATIECSFGEQVASLGIWAIGGHVFSMETARPLKPLHDRVPFSIIGATFHHAD